MSSIFLLRFCWFVCYVQIFCVHSCLEYGHLLNFGTARGYLKRLDALQCRAASVCHSTFSSLESCRHATAIGLLCQLLDGKGCGNLQSLLPPFMTSVPRRSVRLNNLLVAFRLQNTITFKSLDCYRRSWCGAIPSLWNILPADLLLRGYLIGWCSVLKDLQRCCCR